MAGSLLHTSYPAAALPTTNETAPRSHSVRERSSASCHGKARKKSGSGPVMLLIKLEDGPVEGCQEGAGSGEHPVPPEDSDSEQQESTKKKEKVVAMLTENEEASMVEWLEGNPVLYNRKLKNYKDANRKKALWREKAAQMDQDVLILKTWYSSLRTRFGRLKKLREEEESPELTERDSWILKRFEFLTPHILPVLKRRGKKRKLGVNVPPTTQTVSSCNASPSSSCGNSVEAHPMSPLTSNSTNRPAFLCPTLWADVGNNQLDDKQRQLLNQRRPEGDGKERDAFAEWLRSALHNFEHSLWRRCQRELSDVMYRFIAENDALRAGGPATGQFSAGPFSQGRFPTEQNDLEEYKWRPK